MASLRAEREQATALLRRARWQIEIVVGVVLLAIAGLLVLAGGKSVPSGRSAYEAGTTDPVAAAVPQAAVRARHDYSPSPTSYGQLAAAFPATVGRDFATALAQQGGNPAVDAAFRRPPTSTAQVIDPKAYQDGVEPLGVRPRPGEGQRVDAGTLGQFGLAALITGGRRATNGGAAGGWLGDSYGTFRSRRRLCTYVNVVLADTESREQLVRDLGRFVAGRGGRAEVTRSAERGVPLRSCA